jgi:hypothetical protein
MPDDAVDRASEPPPRSSMDRTILVIGGGVLALVVLAAAVVLLVGGREPVSYPADSPEGVLQRYLAAFEAGDLDEAHGYFSSAVREEMDLEAFERTARDYGLYPSQTSRRILFDRSEIEGDTARVHLTVEEFYGGGPFGAGETYRSPRVIALAREDGAWRIDEALIGLDQGVFSPEFGP